MINPDIFFIDSAPTDGWGAFFGTGLRKGVRGRRREVSSAETLSFGDDLLALTPYPTPHCPQSQFLSLPMLFSEQILRFYKNVKFDIPLQRGTEVMIPFSDKQTLAACRSFYTKFYHDNSIRRMIIGINPGRFGGGVTGIPFTDPIRLEQSCGITNDWPKKQELSSLFVYEMIEAFGGPATFYKKFYITSVSPLGFTQQGKNLNYYDDKQLHQAIRPFVMDCFKRQFKFGIDRSIAYCLGDGKNFKYLQQLNQEEKLFDKIIPLSHPRFIMQYKLKAKSEYVRKYLEALRIS